MSSNADMRPAPSSTGAARSSARIHLALAARLGASLVLLLACGWALTRNWSAVRPFMPVIGWRRGAIATALAMLGTAGTFASWRTVVSDMAGPIGVADSAAVYGSSQLGKYLPGSVWPAVAQASLARRYSLSGSSMVAAFLIQLVVMVVAAIATAAGILPFVDGEALQQRWWLLLVMVAAFASLHPASLRLALRAVSVVTRRQWQVAIPSMGTLCRAAAISVAGFVAFGLHLAVLAAPLSHGWSARLIAQSIGAYSLAWAAGFIVVFAPAGLGVREVVLAVAMADFLRSDDAATALALASRASITSGDLAVGLVGIAYLWWVRRRGALPITSSALE